MKTLRLTTLIIAFTLAYTANAQSQVAGVRITEPAIDKVDELVTVQFTATTGKKTVKRNHSLLLAPSITDGKYTWSLPPLVISGRGGQVSLDRQMLASRGVTGLDDAHLGRTGGEIHYTASVPYQQWMEGARLTLESMIVGCCSTSEVQSHVMAEEMKLQPTVEEYAVLVAERNRPQEVAETTHPTVTVIEAGPMTTGDKLAESYTFLSPASEFKPIRPGELYDEDREGTIRIRYALGSSTVQRGYADNEQALTDLMASIRILEDSHDTKVKLVTIAGFASPDGSREVNDRLAWNRAVAMKEYIVAHSSLNASQIEIYNGSVDWQGLRLLLQESDLSWAPKAISIIENTPVWDAARNVGVHGELMRLDGGNPYRYMKEHMFPKLRNAAYIRLYYAPKSE